MLRLALPSKKICQSCLSSSSRGRQWWGLSRAMLWLGNGGLWSTLQLTKWSWQMNPSERSRRWVWGLLSWHSRIKKDLQLGGHLAGSATVTAEEADEVHFLASRCSHWALKNFSLRAPANDIGFVISPTAAWAELGSGDYPEPAVPKGNMCSESCLPGQWKWCSLVWPQQCSAQVSCVSTVIQAKLSHRGTWSQWEENRMSR